MYQQLHSYIFPRRHAVCVKVWALRNPKSGQLARKKYRIKNNLAISLYEMLFGLAFPEIRRAIKRRTRLKHLKVVRNYARKWKQKNRAHCTNRENARRVKMCGRADNKLTHKRNETHPNWRPISETPLTF